MNTTYVDAQAWGTRSFAPSSGTLRTKLSTSVVIFCVSLFAVSFPSLSKRVKYIRIPSIVFFLGKHFGTGVILSTAFVHLLADAFKSLQSEWTGLIVLVSLLAIFLVEYISTAYVDHLHSYSSEPSTPIGSSTPTTSRPQSVSSSRTPQELLVQGDKSKQSSPALDSINVDEDATTAVSSPLCTGIESAPLTSSVPNTYGSAADGRVLLALPPGSLSAEEQPKKANVQKVCKKDGKECHCTCEGRVVSAAEVGKDDEIFGGGHHRHESRSMHASHSGRSKKITAVVLLEGQGQDQDQDVGETSQLGHEEDEDEEEETEVEVETRERHRAHDHPHTHGHGHGHGHGHNHHGHVDIERWAGGEMDDEDEHDELLHHGHGHGHGHDHAGHVSHSEEVTIGRRRQIVGILMLQIGIMLHSLVIGLTLAITTGPEFTTLVTAILFHQLFEGLSLGIRIAALPAASASSSLSRSILKPTLATSFALTTPLGISLGVVFVPPSSAGKDKSLMRMQGVMSAMSAGMLIYAACVEMLAGDFVMDPLMWRSKMRRQVMALGSLAAGVCAMALVGMWD